MSDCGMAHEEQAAIRARILGKPDRVVVVIKMLAVKLSGDSSMATDEEIAFWMKAGLAEWEEIAARIPSDCGTEEQFAEQVIDRIRAEQPDGWGRILRGHAQ